VKDVNKFFNLEVQKKKSLIEEEALDDLKDNNINNVMIVSRNKISG